MKSDCCDVTPSCHPVWVNAYRSVLAHPHVRMALTLGLLMRIPLWSGGVLLALHVVSSLGRSYTEAGVVTLASTIALAIAGPVRGRLLDGRGLRAVVLPSIAVLAICWSIAPFVSYLPLIGLVAVAGLFNVPTFSIIRQTILAVVSEDERRTALSLDSVATEASYMIGPIIGVWLGTTFPTSWGLFGSEMCGVLAAVALWKLDPPLRSDAAEGEARPGFRSWFTPGVAAVLFISAACTIVLTGTDLGLVALLREAGSTPLLGIVLSVWGLGSLVGGLVYGALHHSVPAWVLLLLLGVVTLPVGISHSVPLIALLAGVAGLLCAPTITATVEQLTALVGERNRGEALGWHGSFMTGGSALGAPLTGAAIDHSGSAAGFVVVGVVGVVVALLGAAALMARRRVLAYAGTR